MAFWNKQKNEIEEEISSGELLAQDIIPLESAQGVFMRVNDGSSTIAIYIEGTNDSLYTYEQKYDEALAFSSCLLAVTWPFSIIKLPKTIDANAALVRTDSEIAALREDIFNCSDPVLKNILEIRLRYLSEYIRDEAESEALAGDRMEYPTYIVLRFPPDVGDSIALRDAKDLVQRFEETGRYAHICSTAEYIEALQLFFKRLNVDSTDAAGRKPVRAK